MINMYHISAIDLENLLAEGITGITFMHHDGEEEDSDITVAPSLVLLPEDKDRLINTGKGIVLTECKESEENK